MRLVGVSGKVTIMPMVVESSRGFRLPLTEKIFSYRLDTAKADVYNRAKERKGKENDNADSNRGRKEV
jgi:hypothetical protein